MRQGHEIEADRLRKYAEKMDEDRSGAIEKDELRRLLRQLKIDVDEDELRAVLECLDIDGDGLDELFYSDFEPVSYTHLTLPTNREV